MSCPNVRAEAYVPERVDEQMSANVQDWLANANKGSAVESDVLTVSAIFKWFQQDFAQSSGSP